MSTIVSHSPLNISETVRARGLVPKDHQYGIGQGVTNSHVTVDVTWPRTGKLNRLRAQYLESNYWRCYL